jgi:hypothetical protein
MECIECGIIDTVHGIGNRKLILYIHVRPPMHYIWQLKSDLYAAFAFILAPETLALLSTKA